MNCGIPLRVLIIAPYCDGTDVGEAWSSYQWVSRLAQHHQITLLTYSKRGRPLVAAQLPGVEVIEWRDWPVIGCFERFNSGLKPGYISFYWRASHWIRRALTCRSFDLIHQLTPLALRYPSPAVGFGIPLITGPLAGSLPAPPGFSSELRRSAWFTKLRSIDSWRMRYDPMLRRSYSDAAVIIGVAPYVRDLLRSVPIRRFEIMSETGIVRLATYRRRTRITDGKALRLLFVGRVVRSKGARDAIRAMAHLSDCPLVTLDIVGDGEDIRACKQEAEELGVANRVFFRGHMPRSEVESFYAGADVLLFPSLREPSGNAVLEAMGHGLALIVADNGGPAFAADEECGIHVKPCTPSQYALDLATSVRRLVENPGLLRAMQNAAFCRAGTVFLWDRKIEWMCRLYGEVTALGTRQKPSRSLSLNGRV